MGFARRMRRKGLGGPKPFALDIETWTYRKPPLEPREKGSRICNHPESNRITDNDREVGNVLGWRAWDGHYVKEHFFIRYAGGDRMVLCWPNAGYMNASDGSGRVWSPDPAFEVVSATAAGWSWEEDR